MLSTSANDWIMRGNILQIFVHLLLSSLRCLCHTIVLFSILLKSQIYNKCVNRLWIFTANACICKMSIDCSDKHRLLLLWPIFSFFLYCILNKGTRCTYTCSLMDFSNLIRRMMSCQIVPNRDIINMGGCIFIMCVHTLFPHLKLCASICYNGICGVPLCIYKSKMGHLSGSLFWLPEFSRNKNHYTGGTELMWGKHMNAATKLIRFCSYRTHGNDCICFICCRRFNQGYIWLKSTFLSQFYWQTNFTQANCVG